TGKAEVADSIRKAGEERHQAQKEREHHRTRLAEHEAQTLLAQAEAVEGRRLLVRVLEEADAGYLRLLAARVVKQPDVQLLLATRSTPVALVFAQTPGLSSDMNALLRQTFEKHGGKGGGSRDFAQGSLPAEVSPDDLLAEAAEVLRGQAAH
ncbi:MAG: DHHA1 domain-containing protein, partial [Candidatus Acidiferrales bacterium]